MSTANPAAAAGDGAGASQPEKKPSRAMQQLQRFGRSLMLPIAALPAAGILLRLGQDDMIGRFDNSELLMGVAAVLAGAGDALFANLGYLFAVGLAFGFAKKGDGSAAMAGLVGYLVLLGVFDAMAPIVLGAPEEGAEDPVINYGVLGGILVGVTAAKLWERYHRIKLPDWLGFFGGRRFVPIVVAAICVPLGVVMALVYPFFDAGLTWLSDAVAQNAVVGGGIYGVINRLLIPLGLHHILNFPLWFQIGEYDGAHGDIYRFFAGDPSAGIFTTGFFPIMMFALPAAALAIYHEAKPKKKKVTGGIMLSMALTAFVTGITEPLEFSFMFVAWPLYLIHAVLTGTSMALVNALDIHMGFSFSAGGIDYLINFGRAQKPLLLALIGIGYAVVYYVLFRFVIRRWNLRTPGREDESVDAEMQGKV
ncbi:PTS transporter subunit EIIC [Kocuria palustris]|uniref:PTS transporter subunit EIIC n=1 Tax=Kocuria palustris TaxID=71999 RepID=UPI0021A44D2C|nr:PTS transporter subunit EIIC [Kocuria palustris]MCT1834689.1 PTS transporter subunit EIIC [Kocuria palustris]